MKVLFLTHYYAPEIGAPQTRIRETIAVLRDLGVECSVLTGPPHYPRGKILDGRRLVLPRTESLDGVPVLRVPMWPRPNRGLMDRLIDHGSFAATATLMARHVRKHDVVVVESPPLFLGITARVLRFLTRRPYVFHVADPWPDFPIAAGAIRGRLPIALAVAIESMAYSGAAAITTVSPPIVERLEAKPGARGKVVLVPNAVTLDRFRPDEPIGAAKRALGWPDDLSLVYAGTVGLAQGLGTLIDALLSLPLGQPIQVHVVGEGGEFDVIRERARNAGLSHVHFHRGVARDDVPAILAAADGVLVFLKRGPLYEESLPTKLVEGLAAGRPIILSASGYAADLVRTGGAGFAGAAEDPAALAQAIGQFMSSRDRMKIGASARSLAESMFDRAAAVSTLSDLLERVVHGSARQRHPSKSDQANGEAGT